MFITRRQLDQRSPDSSLNYFPILGRMRLLQNSWSKIMRRQRLSKREMDPEGDADLWEA